MYTKPLTLQYKLINRTSRLTKSYLYKKTNHLTYKSHYYLSTDNSNGSISSQIKKLQSDYSNIPDKILELVDKQVHHIPNHPISIIKSKIKEFFTNPNIYKSKLQNDYPLTYNVYDNISPIVTTQQCFDDLLVPPDHPSRKRSDTYYINKETMLRTHTSAHQKGFLSKGENSFIVFGDVYRRDAIDATHYPCFHQVNHKSSAFMIIINLNLVDGRCENIYCQTNWLHTRRLIDHCCS